MNTNNSFKIKNIIFLLIIYCNVHAQIYGDLQYSKPRSLYVGSPVDEIKEINRTASQRYNSSKSKYEGTLNLLDELINDEKKQTLNRNVLEKSKSMFKQELNKYVEGGNWQDASYDVDVASKNIEYNIQKLKEEGIKEINNNTDNGYKELKNNPNTAIQYFDKALAIDCEYANAIYGKALALHYKAKYDESIDLINTALTYNPKEYTFYTLRGRNYLIQKKYNSALEDFNKAIEGGENNEEKFYIGKCYLKLQKFQQAIDILNVYIENNPNDANAYISRAQSYSGLGKHEEAIKDCKKNIELNPTSSMGYNNYAWELFLLKKYKEALIFSNKAVDLNNKNETALDTRAEIKYNLGDFNGAISDCDLVLLLNTNMPNSYLIKGKSKLKLGKKSEACESLKKANDLGNIEALNIYSKNCN